MIRRLLLSTPFYLPFRFLYYSSSLIYFISLCYPGKEISPSEKKIKKLEQKKKYLHGCVAEISRLTYIRNNIVTSTGPWGTSVLSKRKKDKCLSIRAIRFLKSTYWPNSYLILCMRWWVSNFLVIWLKISLLEGKPIVYQQPIQWNSKDWYQLLEVNLSMSYRIL